jgi:hypothetical protein
MLSGWVHVNLTIELADAIQFCIAVVLHSLKLFTNLFLLSDYVG